MMNGVCIYFNKVRSVCAYVELWERRVYYYRYKLGRLPHRLSLRLGTRVSPGSRGSGDSNL